MTYREMKKHFRMEWQQSVVGDKEGMACNRVRHLIGGLDIIDWHCGRVGENGGMSAVPFCYSKYPVQ